MSVKELAHRTGFDLDDPRLEGSLESLLGEPVTASFEFVVLEEGTL